MKKKEAIDNTTVNTTVKKEVKVVFKNTYIGKLGTYFKDKVYILPHELYKILSIDCEEIK
jgi:hypothetical protein